MPFLYQHATRPLGTFQQQAAIFMPAIPDLQAAVAAVTNPDWRSAARRVVHALNAQQPLVSQGEVDGGAGYRVNISANTTLRNIIDTICTSRPNGDVLICELEASLGRNRDAWRALIIDALRRQPTPELFGDDNDGTGAGHASTDEPINAGYESPELERPSDNDDPEDDSYSQPPSPRKPTPKTRKPIKSATNKKRINPVPIKPAKFSKPTKKTKLARDRTTRLSEDRSPARSTGKSAARKRSLAYRQDDYSSDEDQLDNAPGTDSEDFNQPQPKKRKGGYSNVQLLVNQQLASVTKLTEAVAMLAKQASSANGRSPDHDPATQAKNAPPMAQKSALYVARFLSASDTERIRLGKFDELSLVSLLAPPLHHQQTPASSAPSTFTAPPQSVAVQQMISAFQHAAADRPWALHVASFLNRVHRRLVDADLHTAKNVAEWFAAVSRIAATHVRAHDGDPPPHLDLFDDPSGDLWDDIILRNKPSKTPAHQTQSYQKNGEPGKDICRRFNKGVDHTDCQYRHVCSVCFSRTHPAISCFRNSGSNSGQHLHQSFGPAPFNGELKQQPMQHQPQQPNHAPPRGPPLAAAAAPAAPKTN